MSKVKTFNGIPLHHCQVIRKLLSAKEEDSLYPNYFDAKKTRLEMDLNEFRFSHSLPGKMHLKICAKSPILTNELQSLIGPCK